MKIPETILIQYMFTFILIIASYFFFRYTLKNEDEMYLENFEAYKSFYFFIFVLSLAYPVLNIIQNGFSLENLLGVVLAVGLGWSCIIDFRHQELPDTITFLSLLIAICLVTNTGEIDSLASQCSAISVIVTILFVICKTITGIGMGDIKLIIPLMLMIPVSSYLSFFCNSLLLGLIYAISLMIFKKVQEDRHFAFGPFLIGGFYLTLFGFDFLSMLTSMIINLL